MGSGQPLEQSLYVCGNLVAGDGYFRGMNGLYLAGFLLNMILRIGAFPRAETVKPSRFR